MSTENGRVRPDRNQSRSSAEAINIRVPLPAPGESALVSVPRYNLTVLVERGKEETQEELRQRYVVVAPIGGANSDRRLHVARLGTGGVKAKKMAVTLCTEHRPQDNRIRSGARVDVDLEVVTCAQCRKVLASEGVLITEEQR